MNLEQYQIDATDWEEHDGKCICGKLQYDGDIEITIDHGHYTWLSIGRMSNGTHYLCASGDDEATAEITYCPFCGKKNSYNYNKKYVYTGMSFKECW